MSVETEINVLEKIVELMSAEYDDVPSTLSTSNGPKIKTKEFQYDPNMLAQYTSYLYPECIQALANSTPILEEYHNGENPMFIAAWRVNDIADYESKYEHSTTLCEIMTFTMEISPENIEHNYLIATVSGERYNFFVSSNIHDFTNNVNAILSNYIPIDNENINPQKNENDIERSVVNNRTTDFYNSVEALKTCIESPFGNDNTSKYNKPIIDLLKEMVSTIIKSIFGKNYRSISRPAAYTLCCKLIKCAQEQTQDTYLTNPAIVFSNAMKDCESELSSELNDLSEHSKKTTTS